MGTTGDGAATPNPGRGAALALLGSSIRPHCNHRTGNSHLHACGERPDVQHHAGHFLRHNGVELGEGDHLLGASA